MILTSSFNIFEPQVLYLKIEIIATSTSLDGCENEIGPFVLGAWHSTGHGLNPTGSEPPCISAGVSWLGFPPSSATGWLGWACWAQGFAVLLSRGADARVGQGIPRPPGSA